MRLPDLIAGHVPTASAETLKALRVVSFTRPEDLTDDEQSKLTNLARSMRGYKFHTQWVLACIKAEPLRRFTYLDFVAAGISASAAASTLQGLVVRQQIDAVGFSPSVTGGRPRRLYMARGGQ